MDAERKTGQQRKERPHHSQRDRRVTAFDLAHTRLATQQVKGWDQRPRAEELKAVKVPTLVLVGGNEPQMTIQLAYDWHKLIPNSEYIILPETHHSASLENPAGWNNTILGFLKRHNL